MSTCVQENNKRCAIKSRLTVWRRFSRARARSPWRRWYWFCCSGVWGPGGNFCKQSRKKLAVRLMELLRCVWLWVTDRNGFFEGANRIIQWSSARTNRDSSVCCRFAGNLHYLKKLSKRYINELLTHINNHWNP